jgi:hypothetical protein
LVIFRLTAFFMRELEHFINAGFGWVCRKCEPGSTVEDDSLPSRLMREGEAESKNPRLSNQALARWADREHTTLECPQCGITEEV